MTKAFIKTAAAIALLAGSTLAAQAQGWERKGTIVGPNGGVTTYGAEGHCDGTGCTVQRGITGPNGNTISGTTTTTRNGQGGWSRNSEITGPGGNTVQSQGSGQCVGGNCTWQGGGTGPAGGTWKRQGSVTRN